MNRRICIRMVKFCRSMCDVQMRAGSGSPDRTFDITSTIGLGEYFASASCCPLAVKLYQLREVHLCAERVLDVAVVEHETVRCELNSSGDAFSQFVDEAACRFLVAFADREHGHQLGIGVHCYEHPLIAYFLRSPKIFRIQIQPLAKFLSH